MSSLESAIKIVNLRKSFDGGQQYVLDGLTLEIPRNKITIIIGFSGTGKSVLLKHVLGLLRPTSGRIEILGEDVTQMSDRQINNLRKQIGVLFQNAALFDDMSAVDNVCFPLLEHRRELAPEQVKEIAYKKLNLVGLDSSSYDKLPASLSGGMRKRVGLARALALDPEILFYDEPTTGLDPIRTEMVDNLIYETHHKGNHTSIVISHDLHSAFRMADQVAMLDGGKVLLVGTPEEFRNSNIDLVQRFIEKGVHRK